MAVIRSTQLKLQHVLDIFMNLVTRIVRKVRGQALKFLKIETSCYKISVIITFLLYCGILHENMELFHAILQFVLRMCGDLKQLKIVLPFI